MSASLPGGSPPRPAGGRLALSPRGYVVGWALLVALAALPFATADDPDWFGASLDGLVIVGPVAAPLLWGLRLADAGRSGWWAVLIVLVLGGVVLVISDIVARAAGLDPRRLADAAAQAAVWQAVMPTLAVIVVPVVAAATLVIGMLRMPRPESARRGP
jgi:hypothetical protein